ncbi:glutaredoxin domain-containing protein [Aquabacterium sp.]|uniref:glutaredoxin domain-containing protein n=1 Tax=Aquabacterium sp. TaxID=1872578 RepID=UPI003784EA51
MIRLTSFSAALLCLAGSALAQYKVVGPDGKVTYTDRPPVAEPSANIKQLGRTSAQASAASNLPAELRPIVQRFPVVFYSAPECGPCDSARALLKARGIPMTERQVLTTDDLPALERATGSRSLPALTVGGQTAAGYSESQWHNLLDLAGYPRDSKLPRDYVAAPATPLVARQAAAPAPAPAPAAPPAAAEPEAPAASGIRF